MLLNEQDALALMALAFSENNPGYRPQIIESPNGDGKWDGDKQYAHIAEKYLRETPMSQEKNIARQYLIDATNEARALSMKLGVPEEYWPDHRYSCIRVLKYKPGALTHPHTDFDLFTLMLYRNIREPFTYHEKEYKEYPMIGNGYPTVKMDITQPPDKAVQDEYPMIHFGELLNIVCPTYFATRHSVKPINDGRWQYSIVFFAIPDEDAILPDGQRVGDWIEERKARSRRYVN